MAKALRMPMTVKRHLRLSASLRLPVNLYPSVCLSSSVHPPAVCTALFIFVRDGIPSFADYNSTLMGAVVVVAVVVALFRDGIT